MPVHSLKPEPHIRAASGATLPSGYTPPAWTGNRRAMQTSSGVLIGAALIRPNGPAANDDQLTLVPHEMTEDGERVQAALLDPRTKPRRLCDWAQRTLHVLRTDVRAWRLLRAALHEATTKRLASWL